MTIWCWQEKRSRFIEVNDRICYEDFVQMMIKEYKIDKNTRWDWANVSENGFSDITTKHTAYWYWKSKAIFWIFGTSEDWIFVLTLYRPSSAGLAFLSLFVESFETFTESRGHILLVLFLMEVSNKSHALLLTHSWSISRIKWFTSSSSSPSDLGTIFLVAKKLAVIYFGFFFLDGCPNFFFNPNFFVSWKT